jgi:hypothetical protein
MWEIHPLLADVIFPAPSAAYYALLFIPSAAVAALATEYVVYYWFQEGVANARKMSGIVVGVNIFSWVIGVILSSYLPSFLVPKLIGEGKDQFSVVSEGPHWAIVAEISFVWACFLSTVLEYGALWVFKERLKYRKLGLCVTLANIAGYVAIAGVVALHLLSGWI